MLQLEQEQTERAEAGVSVACRSGWLSAAHFSATPLPSAKGGFRLCLPPFPLLPSFPSFASARNRIATQARLARGRCARTDAFGSRDPHWRSGARPWSETQPQRVWGRDASDQSQHTAPRHATATGATRTVAAHRLTDCHLGAPWACALTQLRSPL